MTIAGSLDAPSFPILAMPPISSYVGDGDPCFPADGHIPRLKIVRFGLRGGLDNRDGFISMVEDKDDQAPVSLVPIRC